MAVRLYVDDGLKKGASFELGPEQTHHLVHVMQLGLRDRIRLFNGRDGEWEAVIEKRSKKCMLVAPQKCYRPQDTLPDLWFLFAALKRNRIDTLVEKATELGVTHFKPVITERTETKRMNVKRLEAYAIEAAEQTERLSIPKIDEAEPLGQALKHWPSARRLLLCDETGGGPPILEVLGRAGPCAWALLTGPEGASCAVNLTRFVNFPLLPPQVWAPGFCVPIPPSSRPLPVGRRC